MAKLKLITIDIRRRPNAVAGGTLGMNYQCTEQERAEAFKSLLSMTLRVAADWKQEHMLSTVAKQILNLP